MDVVPLLLVLAQHLRFAPPQLFRQHEQIIEIDSIIGTQQPLILFIDASSHLFKVFCSQFGHLFRHLHIIFGPRNQALNSSGPILLLVQVQIFDGPLDERSLIIGIEDDKRSIETQRCQVIGLDAQDTCADSMEGADIHFL
jgi:hypothetical protein